MLSKLRADGSYVYKNKLMKWILTKYNLELEMKLISTFNHENILENIQKIGICNDCVFLDDCKFICKWNIRRLKNIKQIEKVSNYFLNLT